MIKFYDMKRFLNLTLIAAASLVLLGSCQQEPAYSPDGTGSVSITLNLDGLMSTKADGNTSSMTVYYEIYEDSDCSNRIYPSSGNAFPVSDMENAVKVSDDGKAHINVELLKDRQYMFVFWAMEDGSPYTWTSLTDISMNWSEAGNDDRDAFYGAAAVKGGESATVTLVRPFAQLNIGAELQDMSYDPEDAQSKTPCVVTSWAPGYYEYHPFESYELVMTGEFADTFNAATAEASASEPVGSLTFKAEGIYGTLEQEDYLEIDQTGSFIHVAMNYILPVSNSTDGIKGTADVTAGFMIGEEADPVSHNLVNVPLEANKRTNIVGTLFTSNGKISVELSSWENNDVTINE